MPGRGPVTFSAGCGSFRFPSWGAISSSSDDEALLANFLRSNEEDESTIKAITEVM